MAWHHCLLLAGTLGLIPCAQAEGWTFGGELDLAPYLLDGHYVSAVVGKGHWRLRLIDTAMTTPAFMTPEGFEDQRIKAQAFVADYYFKPDFRGWWLAAGLERWRGSATETRSRLSQAFTTQVMTVGAGYTLRLSEHVYLNPWAAIHIPTGGDREIAFSQQTLKIRPVPEASLKIGFRF